MYQISIKDSPEGSSILFQKNIHESSSTASSYRLRPWVIAKWAVRIWTIADPQSWFSSVRQVPNQNIIAITLHLIPLDWLISLLMNRQIYAVVFSKLRGFSTADSCLALVQGASPRLSDRWLVYFLLKLVAIAFSCRYGRTASSASPLSAITGEKPSLRTDQFSRVPVHVK